MLQRAAVVVKAKQQRTDRGTSAFLVPAEAGDDAVAVALVLDLEHDALVGLIDAGDGFGDNAVETSAFEAAEPVDGTLRSRVAGVMWMGGAAVASSDSSSARRFSKGSLAEVVFAFAEQVEEDEGGGRLLGEQLDARGGGMDAELERVEIEAAFCGR